MEVVYIADKGINIKVNEDFYKQIKIKIATEGITMKDYIIKLIQKDLKQKNK